MSFVNVTFIKKSCTTGLNKLNRTIFNVLIKSGLFRGTWFSQDSELREYDALIKSKLPNSVKILIF